MSMITEASVYDALRQVQEPELGGDLVTRNMVRDLRVEDSSVAFTIEFEKGVEAAFLGSLGWSVAKNVLPS